MPASPTVSGVIRGYRPDLDGLRTVAVYLVLLFHAGVGWAAGGFIGVDLFFCLSGFLVTGVLLGEVEDTGTLRIGRFYARRVRRLLPAALLVVVATCLVFTLLWSVVPRLAIIGDARSALLYYANWHFLASSGDYFAADVDKSPFLHFWSLSIEEQYYVGFPLLLLLLSRVPRGVRRPVTLGVLGTLLVASLVAQLVLAPGSTDRAYYGTDTRLYQLLAGALLTTWLAGTSRRPSPRVAHVAALLGFAGIVLLGSGLPPLGPSGRGVGATAASVLLLGGLALAEGSPLSRLLATRVPVHLGRISYGTYLWHWPVIIALGALLDAGPGAVALLTAFVATGLAALSYEVLEMPVRRWRRLDARGWPVAVTGVAVSALVAGLVVAPVLSSERKPALVAPAAASTEPAASTRQLEQQLDRPVPSIDFEEAAGEEEHGTEHWCAGDDPGSCTVVHGSGPHVLLVGDSQAETLVPVFERLAREHDLTLSVNVIAGCPWQEGLANDRLAEGRTQECTEARVGWYRGALRQLDPDVVVLLDRPRDDPEEWGGEVTRRDGRSQSLGRAVYETTRSTLRQVTRVAPAVVVQRLVMPETFDPLDCLAGADRLGQCTVSVPVDPSASDGYVSAIAAQDEDVHPLSLGRVFCPTTPVCPPVRDDTVVWRDDHHYTVSWAMRRRHALWEALLGTGLLDGGSRS